MKVQPKVAVHLLNGLGEDCRPTSEMVVCLKRGNARRRSGCSGLEGCCRYCFRFFYLGQPLVTCWFGNPGSKWHVDGWQVASETDFASLTCRIRVPVNERQESRNQQHQRDRHGERTPMETWMQNTHCVRHDKSVLSTFANLTRLPRSRQLIHLRRV